MAVTHRPHMVVSTRGPLIENTHLIHAAIATSSGVLLLSLGDPSRLTLARSAAKPAQALAVLEAGVSANGPDLALLCASHNSEARHLDRVRDLLSAAAATEADLRCGPHPPLMPAVGAEWARMGFVPTPVCNNCSGKHAGMLAAARNLGAGMEGYHLPEHPVQVRVQKVVEELCGDSEVLWAVDGCNLPTPGAPLRGFARMFATFADAVDEREENGDERTRLQGRIFRAMAEYPEMVGGEERFCTALMEAFEGRLIGKVGADGFYAVGIRNSEETRRLGANGGLGIAVKVEDGDKGALYAAVVEILEQIGMGNDKTRQRLEAFHHPKRQNTAGVVVGDVKCAFKLTAC